MYKILTVIGARPQFIKAAAISKIIQDRNDVEEILVHTGQHYDENMSSIFFNELGIPKEKYNLHIGSSSHAKMTADIMIQFEEIVLKEMPDCVLLYGDTNSTVAAALVAAKVHIPIAHVEAGIRSKRKNRAEELNRIITDHLSSLLFPPTEEGVKNLKNEGLFNDNTKQLSNNNPIIANYGDVMYDNFLRFSNLISKDKSLLSKYNLTEENYLLITIHRALNTDNPLKLAQILTSINQISIAEGIKVVFPVHPRTLKQYNSELLIDVRKLIESNSLFIFIPPVSFFEMMILQKYCKLLITDSGGVQKEAAFFEKMAIVLLESTPWKELLNSGVLIEVGDNPEKIRIAYDEMKTKKNVNFPKIFGNGNASVLILDEIISFIKKYRIYKDEIKFQ